MERSSLMHGRIWIFFCFIVVLGSHSVFAGTTGKISGVIIDDETNRPLPGASVQLKGTTMGASTDLKGYYFISNVSPGTYTIVIKMMGYKTYEVENVRVTTDLTTQIDQALEPTVLLAGESVLVQAKRPMIDPSVTSKSTVVTAKEIESLPITSTQALLTIQSGVIEVKGYNNKIAGFDTRGIDQTHVRGGRNGEIAYMVDGMYVEDAIYAGMGTQINREAIQEMKIEVGGFSAEYGEAQSGVVNIVTKEGAADLGGSFEISTSAWSDAFGEDNILSEADAPRNFHEILTSLSGPVPILPNATFFFGGSQSFRKYDVFEFDDITYDTTSIDYMLDNPTIYSDTYDALQEQITTGVISGYDSVEAMKDKDLRVGDVFRTYAYGDWREAHPFDSFTGWKGFGFNSNWDVISKITMKPTSSMKLVLSDRHTQQRFRNYSFSYQYAEKGRHVTNKQTDDQSVTLTHQLSPETFYTLKGYRFWLQRRYYVYGPNNEVLGPEPETMVTVPTDQPGVVDTLDFGEPGTADYPSGSSTGGFVYPLGYIYDSSTEEFDDVNGNRLWDEGEPFVDANDNGVFDWGYQTVTRWDPATGDSVTVPVLTGRATQYWTRTFQQTAGVKWALQSQVTREHELKMGFEIKRYKIGFKELQYPWIQNPYSEWYSREPEEASFYIQDKMDFGRVYVNLGGRIDYVDSKRDHWENPSDPTSEFATAEKKTQISPRMGFGYPITDKMMFHFNYGHFFQVPEYRNLYLGSTLDLNTPRPLIGNPHLAAQKTVSFEFGVKFEFVDNWAIQIIPWKKDMTGLSGSNGFIGFDADTSGGRTPLGSYSFYTYLNHDHGSARGVDIIVDKSFSDNWYGQLNYTWSQARANRYYSWSGYWDSETAENEVKKEILMDYDQPHVLTVNASYSVPKKGGPSILGMKPFGNSLMNFLINAASGFPYTPSVGSRPADPNSARKPSNYQVDVVFRKDFYFGRDSRIGLFARVTNLFDRLNVYSVYSGTGMPDLPVSGSTRTSTYYNRPYYYGPRRGIDLGFRLSF